MIKKISYLLLLLPFMLFSQEETVVEEVYVEEAYVEETVQHDDSRAFVYNKSIEFERKREFTNKLKDKYSGRDFTYTVEEEKENKKEKLPEPDLTFVMAFAAFMKMIFPFLLGAIVIFIILRLYLGAPGDLWNTKNVKHKPNDKLVYEDDDIENSDLEALLKRAIANKDSRLAIRYYYLILLKKLSNKEMIKYDKDKTNSEYLFEIKDKAIRKEFSYLSYIYSYVWYGEFVLSEDDFLKVEERYTSFFKNIS